MNIHHVALYTKNLDQSRIFYKHYFGGVAGARYHNRRTGLQTYFLRFGEGASLEIMARPGLPDGAAGESLGYTHLAFDLGSPQEVDRLTGRLRAEGVTVCSEPRFTGDGYYESCVLDPDGNRVEIVCRP